MECLDDDTVFAFVRGDLPEAARDGVEQHLKGCAACSLLVAEVAHSVHPAPWGAEDEEGRGALPPPAAATPARLEPGTAVGRYLVEAYIAHGGGGTVYEAHDPQLKRKVALKLLTVAPVEGLSAKDVQAHLLREAEAMARLSHPNIVGIYDAAVHGDGRVFIVLELVEGQTLARWLCDGRRSWRQILTAFLAAGEGLIAIHEAALVHGDFKPANVLVGRDGRIRIADFGLSKALPARLEPAAPGLGQGSAGGVVTTVGGTPLFMAPEVKGGAAAGARADQYSFCVSLFLALTGRHPTDDKVMNALARAQGYTPASDPAPAALIQALQRGLHERPELRYPGLRGLLDALAAAGAPASSDPRRRTYRAAAVVGGGVLILALGSRLPALLHSAECGNGVVEAGEECDDGDVDTADSCLPDCRRARCGDGHLWRPVEDCDDGNQKNGDACTAQCRRCPADPAAAFLWAPDGQNSHCYELDRAPVDWEAARKSCALRGSVLASYTNVIEVFRLSRAFRGTETWIGLRRRPAGKAHTWVTGEATVPSGYEGHIDAPDPLACVRQVNSRPSGRHWFPTSCEDRHAFVCEQVDWHVDPAHHHAYRVFYDQQSWSEAKRSCERMGAHLATITSTHELDLTSNRVDVEVWIGASDEEKEGTFTWVTAEPFEFQAFISGELDKGAPTARNDCVVLGVDGLWHDRACSKAFSYLCEVE